MRIQEALIAWSRWDSTSATRGRVQVGPLLNGGPDWTAAYDYTGGAAYTSRRKLKGRDAERLLAMDFIHMVIRDGVDPKEVHRAFLAIDQYRQNMLPPDVAGATDEDDRKFTDANDLQLSPAYGFRRP